MLRGDFLEYQIIGAQKYRHALRENGAICCFFENGWVEIKVDKLLAKYSSGN